MSKLSRRDFIKSSMLAGATIAVAAPFSKVRGANDDIRLAVVGVGGQGGGNSPSRGNREGGGDREGGERRSRIRGHCGTFNRLDSVRVVAVCDADQTYVDRTVEAFKQQNQTVKGYQDVRKLLEDKEIDVITSATPNHWHSLVTIWACQAGKDVYIEKPISHNVWEGRKAIEAASKYNRIVQTGTQKRSDLGLMEVFKYMQEGNLGAIKWSRGFCYKGRYSGRGIVNGTNGPNLLPDTIDYNLWCGPAEMEPLRREQLHYKWHWVWNTGNGDVGNQGIHEMDLARWGLGDPPHLAPGVMSIGGRFGVGDAGETPNTQIVFLDYKPAPLIFEVRGLPRKKGERSMDNYRGTRVGIVVQCENGYFVGGGGGGWTYDNNGERLKQFKGEGGGSHHQNFIDAVRSHKVSDLNSDIEKGHYSSALCHMGNASHRLGKKMPADEIKKAIGDNAELMDSFERMLEHLKANEVNLEKEPITMGPMLTMDPEKEKFVGEYSEWANLFVKRNYREPFVVPDNV